ncbi:MAG: DUF2088 domain-containing protein [Planctomycetes bacterium]|nr:DUF2088 domain-containing protein [Planctomycetota bacterium]
MKGEGYPDRVLPDFDVRKVLAQSFSAANLEGQRVLVLVPDGTRSGPQGLFFRLIYELLAPRVKALDFLIALGTHQPMKEDAICKRWGVTPEELKTKFAKARIFNHEWQKPETFVTAGTLDRAEIARLSGGRLEHDVPVRLNKMLFEYDRVIVCGPVFPHEVAGYSGGTKYFFPGVSGPEVINTTHWIGALITCFHTIGIKQTPVRDVIDRAASFITTPKLFICYVTSHDHLHGVYVSEDTAAWSAAAELSSQVHVKYLVKPYKQVLAVMPEMYDDIWVAGKGMYKLEPIVADGGELIIYAPHIDEISYTHGKVLDEIGYHTKEYFVQQWEKFRNYPWGTLAHSTHVKGMGGYKDGIETPRVTVTLATRIPESRVRKVNLNYRDPGSIQVSHFRGREDEGILVVDHAGEVLHRLKP